MALLLLPERWQPQALPEALPRAPADELVLIIATFVELQI